MAEDQRGILMNVDSTNEKRRLPLTKVSLFLVHKTYLIIFCKALLSLYYW